MTENPETEPYETECAAEFIDGTWHLCGCEDCQQLAHEDPDGCIQ